jgi:hypothetical protein
MSPGRQNPERVAQSDEWMRRSCLRPMARRGSRNGVVSAAALPTPHPATRL